MRFFSLLINYHCCFFYNINFLLKKLISLVSLSSLMLSLDIFLIF
jgi:hypothetical protein